MKEEFERFCRENGIEIEMKVICRHLQVKSVIRGIPYRFPILSEEDWGLYLNNIKELTTV